MLIELKRQLNQIKAGWHATAVSLGLAARGYSPEVAEINLKAMVGSYFAPFAHNGTLAEEIEALGVSATDDGGSEVLEVQFADD